MQIMPWLETPPYSHHSSLFKGKKLHRNQAKMSIAIHTTMEKLGNDQRSSEREEEANLELMGSVSTLDV